MDGWKDGYMDESKADQVNKSTVRWTNEYKWMDLLKKKTVLRTKKEKKWREQTVNRWSAYICKINK